MDNNRHRLYTNTLLRLLKPMAEMAGVKDFEHCQISRWIADDEDLDRLSAIGYALAKEAPSGDSSVKGELVSIFDKIIDIKERKTGVRTTHVFPLCQLTAIGDFCFPQPYPTQENKAECYSQLWVSLVDELQSVSHDGKLPPKALLSLLKKYTWCVPADMEHTTSTSLYDQAKTATAMTLCLYDYCKATDTATEAIEADTSQEPYMLLGCDVSGIQRFIYDIASRKAAVSLKGRSFYVQLLIDSIIQRISTHESIQAFPSQVVYSSGGKCYMLLPNTAAVNTAIDEIRREVERELFDNHHGQLSLNIDAVPFGIHRGKMHYEGDKEGDISVLWNRLAEKLVERKNRRFISVIDIDLFTPHKVDAQVKVCAVTGIESAQCVPIDPKATDKTYVLPIVKEEAELGYKLKDADYIVSWIGNSDVVPDVTIFGIRHKLMSRTEIESEGLTAESVTVTSINGMNIPQTLIVDADYEFKFYGGNRQALDTDFHNKTFEQLADGQYLGILRMDVDNLGTIFVKGLPERARNFASYSTLSFLLDYFFSGYLNSIRDSEALDKYVNILYSGGDDIFAVGRWDKLLAFAERTRYDFGCYVGREEISISGGIVFVGDTFPIAKAAQMAGDAEDKAKKYGGGQKDAINMFGSTVGWGEEFAYVKGKSLEFVSLIEQYSMPRSILHRLMLLCEQMHKNDVSYIWHTAYYLKRFSDNKHQVVKTFCRELQCILCDSRKYELTAIAARWAEYILRFK